MRIRRERNPYVEGDWEARVVVIWEEDDARPSDRETLDQAWKRIVQREYTDEAVLARVDRDGETARLFRGWWVSGWTCEGAYIGVVAQVVCPLCGRTAKLTEYGSCWSCV